MLQILCIILVVGNVFSHEDRLVDYYENLVKTNIEQLKHYKAPKDNSAFVPKSSKIYAAPDVDFIIIGTGTAGGILASRLSEKPQWKILVLDTGSTANKFSDIPAMSKYTKNSPYDFGYYSLPQKNAALGYPHNITRIQIGKGVGGNSITNDLLYVRGNRYDFDYWAKQGNPGWSFYEVLPNFKKCEKTTINNADPGFHGYSGPISVEYYKSPVPQMDLVESAYKELGIHALDYNGKSQLGFSRPQLMEKDGVRSSVAKGYIDPMIKRNNLQVMDSAYIMKILIDPKDKCAHGVLFSRNGKLIRVKARKEVIVSSGPINTPQVLMLSGIGPKEHLQELGIEVVQDLAVGKNLIDLVTFPGIYFNTNKPATSGTIRDYVKEWLKGKGFYSLATGTQGLAFYKTKYAAKDEGADIIANFVPPNPVSQETKDTSSYKPDIAAALFANVNQKATIQVGVLNTHPVSRGSIQLKSDSPYDFPLVDLNSFNDDFDKDIKVMVEGIKLVLKLLDTPTFKKNKITLAKFQLPPCKHYKHLSDEYWKCAIRQLAKGGVYLFGTCKMGPNPLNGDVVDSNLKVHGIRNLRVVDGSVMIRLSGYPSAATMMIGEKAADMIKKDYQHKPY